MQVNQHVENVSVAHILMSDELALFQTETSLVSGADINPWPERQNIAGVSLDQNPRMTWGMERILAFSHFQTVNFSPAFCSSCVWSPVFLFSPPLCLFSCLWRFILTDVLQSGKSSLKAAHTHHLQRYFICAETLFFFPSGNWSFALFYFMEK